MDMRRNWLFLIGCVVLLPSHMGCRQTTGTSSLTPIGPLAPVNGGTAAAALSPLGQPTRVPPPATGAYSTPNNYMGGAPADGQVYNQVAPYDSFSSVAPGNNVGVGNQVIGSGVAPTSYTAPVAGGGALPGAPATAANPSSMSPTLGGMRVIDMTQSPPPPGYYPSYPTAQQPYANPQGYGGQGYNAQGYQSQNYGSQQTAAPYQAPYDVAPQNYGAPQSDGAPQTYGTPQIHSPDAYPLQDIRVPGPGEIAAGQYGSQPQPTFGNGPAAAIAQREFPMQPSVTEPSFQTGSQFPASQPSTDPIDNQFEGQQADLPWRRPGTQY
tara:strand:+ start:233560 stop:234531 length:972 start_codon:yes stop_codon:yes gene_type:complete